MRSSKQLAASDRNTPLTPLFGASLLSAFGSLSLHVAPVVTLVMISDSRTTVAGAGWVMSLAQFGEFAVTLLLPMLGLLDIGRRAACAIAVALVAGFAMAISRDPVVFLLGWFIIGASSGGLKYLGVMVAARSSRLTLAFSLRLSIILILAGSTGALLASSRSIAGYDALLKQLIVVFAVGLLVGLVLYRGPPSASSDEGAHKAMANNRRKPSIAELSGLVVIYLFFASLSGVIVFALHQAVSRGVATSDAVWVMALTKVAAGTWLMVSCYVSAKRDSADRLLPFSFLLAVATVVIFLSRDNLVLFAGLLIWEIAVNNLSARLQAAVVRNAPTFSGRWLNLAILLGIATGPTVNGLSISHGFDYGYVLFAVLSAFVPAIWLHWRNRMRPAGSATTQTT